MAGTAAAALKTDAATTKLCAELAKLEAKTADDDARKKEIKKDLLGRHAENFQVTIAGLGVVKLSAKRPKECTGTAPEIVVEAFLGLPEKRRDLLVEQGVVKIAEQWKGAYYGSVSVELF